MQGVVIGTPPCAKEPQSYLEVILAARSGQSQRQHGRLATQPGLEATKQQLKARNFAYQCPLC